MISVLLFATILATSYAIPFKDGSFVNPKDIPKVPIGPTSDEYVRDLMVNIGKNAEVFADVAHHAKSQETVDSLFDATETIKGGMIDEPPALQIQCLVCEQLIEILQRGLTEAGDDPDVAWEALRPIAEELCNTVLGVGGLNAEAMCPGIMGHYVPHLLYILHNKTMSPSYACTELNFCDVEDINADGQALPIYIKDNETPMERFDDRKKRQTPGPTFRVAFLTDVHIDSRYTVGAPTDCGMIICCRVGADYTGEGSAGRFGSYSCNTPIRTMDMFMQGIANLAEKPDLVLYGGDAPPHALWEETFDGQMQASRATVEAFSRNMPGMRVFPTIGNHETYPGNLYYLPRQEIQDMNRMFTEWWRPLADFSDENVRTWQANGYYTTLIRPGLRILTFNSNYGYTMNLYNLLNVDTLELAQLKRFMNDTLQTARNNNEKVIMLGHHPTGSAQNHWGRFYTDLVLQFGDVIALQQCGHTHRDHFTMFVDQTGQSHGQMFVSPSVTTFGAINPSARVFTLDSENNLVDYDQYYLDITTADANPNIQLAYSAKQEYGLRDMSPLSWQELTRRFESDQTLFQRYYWHRGTRVTNTECSGDCRDTELCNLRNSVFSERQRCIDAIP